MILGDRVWDNAECFYQGQGRKNCDSHDEITDILVHIWKYVEMM